MRRVAVLGVPRGGTSMTVGLLRILGYQMPESKWDPVCILGEATRLRYVLNEDELRYEELAERVMALPDNTVWKDPVVGEYAHLIDWSTWDVVTIRRQTGKVEDSERRWMGQEESVGTRQRANKWYRNIRNALVETPPAQRLHLPMSHVQSRPRQALLLLSGLSGPMPTGQQVYQALDFVKPGYRCPLPGACELIH